MKSRKENGRMKKEEILELMDLKGWSRTKLASHLDVTEQSIFSWLSGRRTPSGPASILMRQWLDGARAEAKASASAAASVA